MVNQTRKLIQSFRKNEREIRTPIATEMFLPNVSNVQDFARKDRPASSGIKLPIVSKTEAYTATEADHTILCGAGNQTFTVTLPAVSGLAGFILNIKNVGTGVITVDGASAETIDGNATAVINTQFDSITIQCDGSTWWVI